MLRRSFRRGLLLGLLVGVAVAIVKLNQARREAEGAAAPAPPAPWPTIPDTTVVTQAVVDNVTDPAPAIELVDTMDEVPRQGSEPEPVAEEPPITPPVVQPAKKAARKKSAATKASARKKAAVAPWVDPVEGVCPTTHPVKAKLASRLFHLPGMFAYARTRPDRCYVDAAAATADGFIQAKR